MRDFGYPVKKFPGDTMRYVQLLNLRNDPELIREYRRLHSPEAFWEALAGRYQLCAEGATSAAKWQRMERMFCL